MDIYLQGSGKIASGSAWGPAPVAAAQASVEGVPYNRWIQCTATGPGAGAAANGTLLADCGDERTTMISEYPEYGVNWTPSSCSDLASSGGSAHFSWSELNGGFEEGNPHSPWGIVRGELTAGLEATRSNYNRGGIRISSGYRCPHGNHQVGGVAQSIHMKGRAADMFSADHEWTDQEFNLLRDAAEATGPVESFFWNTYADHHYHAAW